MSGITGAKAISLVFNDRISEDCTARVFRVQGSSKGVVYTVVIGSRSLVCTCTAGQNGRECSHVMAARLVMAEEREAS